MEILKKHVNNIQHKTCEEIHGKKNEKITMEEKVKLKTNENLRSAYLKLLYSDTT